MDHDSKKKCIKGKGAGDDLVERAKEKPPKKTKNKRNSQNRYHKGPNQKYWQQVK